MKKNKNKRKLQEGVSFIEIIIGVAMISIITVAIYSSLSGVVRISNDSKQRIGAIALASEKMETIRNLPYEEIGIVNGIVSGPIIAEETVNQNGSNYEIDVDVRYVDDPFDGVFPGDTVSNDYKQAQVSVTWQNSGSDKTVRFFSSFVPNGIETNSGGGTLSVNTITSGGDLVPNVTIRIESLDGSPVISYETSTDDQGNLILPGVPSQNYRLYASKDGYENIQTYPNPPESAFIPNVQDLYVNEGVAINQLSFIIEETADLKIIASNAGEEELIEGIDFEIIGGKKIGTSPDTFNFNEIDSTDSNGEINYSDLSPGSYEIINYDDLGDENFKCVGSDLDSIFQLPAGTINEVNFIFADKDINSLFLTVIDNDTGEPVSGASVQLSGGDLDQTSITGNDGRIYFPLKTDPETVIDADDYDLSISADGFQSHNETIYVNDLITHEVVLNFL
ncbi:MAG: carboxypeptidase-like regulatory domain-containing protein [Patescibacteria group bacterium]|jgi:type II secretory pathway pseudopilin PulG|nr:carboxypeptidase-like regulatory domain-containing protein [Patescibacteria group bacterium]